MMSSLIDMEISGSDEEDKMTTDVFGKLWLTYPHEHKVQWKAPASRASSSHYHHFFNDDEDEGEVAWTIQRLQEQCDFTVVEMIQQECLATRKLHQQQGLVLIHMKLELPYVNITLRSENSSTLYRFSQMLYS